MTGFTNYRIEIRVVSCLGIDWDWLKHEAQPRYMTFDEARWYKRRLENRFLEVRIVETPYSN